MDLRRETTDPNLDALGKWSTDQIVKISKITEKIDTRIISNSHQTESPTDVQNVGFSAMNQDFAGEQHLSAATVENQDISNLLVQKRWQKTRSWVFLCVKKVPSPNRQNICYNRTKTAHQWPHLWPANNFQSRYWCPSIVHPA